MLSKVNAGSVYWNCCDRVSPRLPWSGYGDSGVGLTLSTYGIQTFTRPKAWHLRAGVTPKPKLTLFDLDHTLLSGDSDVLWCEFLMDKGVLPREEFAARNADMEARYKAGTVGVQEFADFYVGTLAGKTPREWDPVRQEFLVMQVVPRIPLAAEQLVERHLDAGDLVDHDHGHQPLHHRTHRACTSASSTCWPPKPRWSTASSAAAARARSTCAKARSSACTHGCRRTATCSSVSTARPTAIRSTTCRCWKRSTTPWRSIPIRNWPRTHSKRGWPALRLH